MLPLYIAVTFLGSIDAQGLTIRGAHFLSIGYIALGAALLIVMAVGAWVGQQLQPHSVPTNMAKMAWRPALWFCGLIVLAAYVFWFKDILFSPAKLWGIMTGAVSFSRSEIGRTVGITSLVSLAPVFFAVYAHLWARERCQLGRGLKALAMLIGVFTVFRVYVWSERLALIEVIAAFFVPLLCAQVQANPSSLFSKVSRMGPYLALPLLAFYFGVWEYFRSWQLSQEYQQMAYWEFALGRFATYYYTSLNNGAGLLATSDWPTYKFEFLAEALYRAPLMVGAIGRYIMQANGDAFGSFLHTYADPEFNNPSGIFAAVYDAGVPLSIIYMFGCGFGVGVLYRSFLSARLAGVLLFPLMLIMISELFRYPYLGSSRAFTAFLGAAAVWLILRHRFGQALPGSRPSVT